MADLDSRRLPAPLRPAQGERGLLTADFPELTRRTLRAWELLIDTAARLEPRAPTRSRGNRVQDLLVSFGTWPDSRGLGDLLADATAGRTAMDGHFDADDRLREAHRHESGATVMAAVQRAADHLRSWFENPAAPDHAHLIGPSPLGPLPVGTTLHAAVFQVAVTVRDLAPAGADVVAELDELGVAALIDSSGAVAARLGATASIAALTDGGVVASGAADAAWRTTFDEPGDQLGPAISGPAGLLLDVAAGRADFVRVARSLRLRQPRRLVDMSVVLDGIPDLPAAATLRRAAAIARAMPF